MAADFVDILQIPAFLCRQTDLLCRSGTDRQDGKYKERTILAPASMRYAVDKVCVRAVTTMWQ